MEKKKRSFEEFERHLPEALARYAGEQGEGASHVPSVADGQHQCPPLERFLAVALREPWTWDEEQHLRGCAACRRQAELRAELFEINDPTARSRLFSFTTPPWAKSISVETWTDPELPEPLRAAARYCDEHSDRLQAAIVSNECKLLPPESGDTPLTPSGIRTVLANEIWSLLEELYPRVRFDDVPHRGKGFFGPEITNRNPDQELVATLWPFYLTTKRRKNGWFVLPYGRYERLSVILRDTHPAWEEWDAIEVLEAKSLPRIDREIDWLYRLLTETVRTGQNVIYGEYSVFHDLREDLVLKINQRLPLDKQVLTEDHRVQPENMRAESWVVSFPHFELPLPMRHVGLSDNWKDSPNLTAEGKAHRVAQVHHGLEVYAGIGISAPLAPRLLQNGNWRKILDRLAPRLRSLSSELNQLGIELLPSLKVSDNASAQAAQIPENQEG